MAHVDKMQRQYIRIDISVQMKQNTDISLFTKCIAPGRGINAGCYIHDCSNTANKTR